MLSILISQSYNFDISRSNANQTSTTGINANESQIILFSQGILLNTAPPPILTTLFALEPIPGISAIPPEAEDGGVEPLAAAGGDELDPKDGGTKEVVFDPALEGDPAPNDVLFDPADEPEPKDVLLEPADEPPRVVLLLPADELALGDESESGKGGTAAPGEEALESGVAGAGEEELESGVAGAGEEELESGVAGPGEEALESGVDAAGLDGLESGAGLASSAPAPGRRLLMLLGSDALSFSMSDANIDFALPPRSPESMPLMPLPLAAPEPSPGPSADGGE